MTLFRSSPTFLVKKGLVAFFNPLHIKKIQLPGTNGKEVTDVFPIFRRWNRANLGKSRQICISTYYVINVSMCGVWCLVISRVCLVTNIYCYHFCFSLFFFPSLYCCYFSFLAPLFFFSSFYCFSPCFYWCVGCCSTSVNLYTKQKLYCDVKIPKLKETCDDVFKNEKLPHLNDNIAKVNWCMLHVLQMAI